MAKLKDGQKFNEVASVYSEDKARQGVRLHTCKCCHIIMNSNTYSKVYLSRNTGKCLSDEKGLKCSPGLWFLMLPEQSLSESQKNDIHTG